MNEKSVIVPKDTIHAGDPDCVCFICETVIPKYPQRWEVSETEEVIVCNQCVKKHVQQTIDTIISMRGVNNHAKKIFRALLPESIPLPRIKDVFTSPFNMLAHCNQYKVLQAAERYLPMLNGSTCSGLTTGDMISIFAHAKNEHNDEILDTWGALLINLAKGTSPDYNRLYISTLLQLSPLDLKVIALLQTTQVVLPQQQVGEHFKRDLITVRLVATNLMNLGLIERGEWNVFNNFKISEFGIIFKNQISLTIIKN